MSKYINADEYQNYLAIARLNHPKSNKLDFNDGLMYAIEAVKSFPSADVVEAEPLRKRIKADLEEANEILTNGIYMSESVKAFQRGRIFAHKFDLLQIERLEEKQNDM